MKGHVLLGIISGTGRGSRLSRSSPPPLSSLGLLLWCECYVNCPLAAVLTVKYSTWHTALLAECWPELPRCPGEPSASLALVELNFSSPLSFCLVSRPWPATPASYSLCNRSQRVKKLVFQRGRDGCCVGVPRLLCSSLFLLKEATGRLDRDSCSSSIDNNAYCLLIDRCILANAHWQSAH